MTPVMCIRSPRQDCYVNSHPGRQTSNLRYDSKVFARTIDVTKMYLCLSSYLAGLSIARKIGLQKKDEKSDMVQINDW